MKIIVKVYSGADIINYYWDKRSMLIYEQGYFAGSDVWGPIITPVNCDKKFETAWEAQQHMRVALSKLKTYEKEFSKL